MFTGLSDPAILANVITARTGPATLHGPTGCDFSRPAISIATEEAFWRVVGGPVKVRLGGKNSLQAESRQG